MVHYLKKIKSIKKSEDALFYLVPCELLFGMNHTVLYLNHDTSY